MPEDRAVVGVDDPSYRRAAGVIWLVVGAAGLVLSIVYSNAWGLAEAALFIAGGILVLSRAYRWAQYSLAPMIGIAWAWVWMTRGWQHWLSAVVGSGLVIIVWRLIRGLRLRQVGTHS